MDETKIEKDQRYKLLSEGERRFVGIPESELGMHYKRPDLAKKQFLLKIKYRVVNAIDEIAWLCNKLPQDQLEKIFFHNDCMECLVETTLKALEIHESQGQKTKASAWTERANRLRPILKKFDRFILIEMERKERDQLLEKYHQSYSNIRLEIEYLKDRVLILENEYNRAINYLMKKGLLKEYTAEKRSTNKEIIRKHLREEGWTEEKINEVVGYMDLANRILVGQHDRD